MQQQASWWSDRTHRTVVAVVAVVVLVVALILWLALRGGGDGGSAQTASSSASSSNSAASGTTINGRSDGPSASATAKASTSTAAPPPAPKPLKNPPKPVQASFGKSVRTGGVTASIVRVESVKGQAHGIGEVAGPALRFTIKVTNQGSKPVNLNLALINVYYGTSKTPASSLSGPGYSPLPQTLKSGSATGRYVFGIPSGKRQTLRVEFSYKANAPTVIFRGSA